MIRLPFIADDLTPVLDRFAHDPCSFTEAEALQPILARGEEVSLREDIRFRPTPWGRWIRADARLINDDLHDALSDALRRGDPSGLALSDALRLRPGPPSPAFCPGDPRFTLDRATIRLAHTPRLRALTPDALDQRAATLLRWLQAAREPASGDTADPGAGSEPPTPPLVIADGRLCLHLAPLSLPRFIRHIRLHGTAHTLPANTLRSGGPAVVPPLPSGYAWEPLSGDATPLDDEDALLLLAPLSAPGPLPDAPTLFGIGEDGTAQRRADARICPGTDWIALLPPVISVELPGAAPLPDAPGWRLWPVLPDRADLLSLLGISTTGRVALRWRTVPSGWCDLAGGPAPVFEPQDSPALEIDLPAGEEAALLCVHPGGTLTLPVPASRAVHWPSPAPGDAIVEIIPRSHTLPRARAAFRVAPLATRPPPATIDLMLEDIPLTASECDLPLADLHALQIKGPPCWPVRLEWHGLRSPRPLMTALRPDGGLDAADALQGDIVACAGRLILDAADLGRFSWRHHHIPTPEDIAPILSRLPPYAPDAPRPAPDILCRLLLRPLLEPLGWLPADPDPPDPDHPDLRCWPMERLALDGSLLRPVTDARLLLLPPSLPTGHQNALHLASALLHRHGGRVLLTDGLTLRVLRPRSPPGPVIPLRAEPAQLETLIYILYADSP